MGALAQSERFYAAPGLPYYLEHFCRVLDGAERQYPLGQHGIDFVVRFRALPRSAQCLYARLVNRKGPYFRVSKLAYPECGALEDAIASLVQAGLAQHVSMQAEHEAGIARCYRAEERRAYSLEWLVQHEPLIAVTRDAWQLITFLYFGELVPNLSDFVIHEIGHVKTEARYNSLRPAFANMDEAQICYRVALLYEEFRAKRDAYSPLDLWHWWQEVQPRDTLLPARARARIDRLLMRLGRALEREGFDAQALQAYHACQTLPCRERAAKLHAKHGDMAHATALCEDMIRAPLSDEEHYRGTYLLARLRRQNPLSAPRARLRRNPCTIIKRVGDTVEQAALDQWQEMGWDGVHTENWIWSGLFGLLMWDVVFDGSSGAFHQPLQTAPSDLWSAAFYTNRHTLIGERLNAIGANAIETVRVTYETKRGITNPFLSWDHPYLPHAERLLAHLTPVQLRAVIERIVRDPGTYLRGFPDLYLWRDDAFRFVEVKSPNDRLSFEQWRWIEWFEQNGIPVEVMRVKYAAV